MSFNSSTYDNLLSATSPQQERLFSQYQGSRTDFDIIIIGSGIGGGVLADDLADRLGKQKRIWCWRPAPTCFPSHVYNFSRFPNAEVADKFECKTFNQNSNEGEEYYIHERPQLNLGGRSIFWSGLIPTVQDWETGFFSPRASGRNWPAGLLAEAGKKMNESITMGTTAQEVVKEASAKRPGPGLRHPGDAAGPPPALPHRTRHAGREIFL
jgi:hypothetical protein